jgi:hypothetical protein
MPERLGARFAAPTRLQQLAVVPRELVKAPAGPEVAEVERAHRMVRNLRQLLRRAFDASSGLLEGEQHDGAEQAHRTG